MLLNNNIWDEALARAQEWQVEDDALVGEQAGSLPHPEQSQASVAEGGGPAVPTRSADAKAARDDLSKPRWSPRTPARWVPTSRGLTCSTPQLGATSRDIAREFNAATHNRSDRPSRGEQGIAGEDDEAADGAAENGRPTRRTTKRKSTLKEPSTLVASVLLGNLLSHSTHTNTASRRSRSVEGTIEMVMRISGRPCQGPHTPSAMD